MRTGVRIGIDVGSVRIGVARSDASGTLAVPVVTVRRGRGDVAKIVGLCAEFEALEILVGNPMHLSGNRSQSAILAQEFATQLAAAVDPIPVLLIDERLTTVEAQRSLQASGVSTRRSKSVIDQAAAVIIVQHALEAERTSGVRIGTTVRTT